MQNLLCLDSPRQIAKHLGSTTYYGVPCVHGHDGKRYTRNCECYVCRAISAREYVRRKRTDAGQKNLGRPRKHPILVGPPKPKRVVFIPVTVEEKWIVRSKKSKKRKLRKDLSIEYYKSLLTTHCPLLEIELSYENYEGQIVPQNYATLDRINPQKGYIKGNVQIISYRANTLKNSASLDEMQLIVKNWTKHVQQ
jgi:hypothetical protein